VINNELEKHIRKVVGSFKDEDELKIILKARLTKREYKMLSAWSESMASEQVCELLKMTSDDYDKVSKKLVKKLNQEKLKQELTD